jgi:stalled ribosome rescue protein Dom34
MDEVVERVLKRYALMRTLDEAQVAESREKISRYIEKLAAAGQKDTHQLAVYGLAYLKELHEGRDPRFTGC